MRYFNLFLIYILLSVPCYAVGWQDVSNCNKEIFIDIDSINYHNNSTYYNVKYYDEKAEQEIIATIQSKGNKAGVVATYKNSEYFTDDVYGLPRVENKEITRALTPKVATKFKEITQDSLLYKANATAMKYIANKDDISLLNADFDKYLKKLQKVSKSYWHPPLEREYCKGQVILRVKIAKNGQTLSNEIEKSCGYKSLDSSAQSAISQATVIIAREFPQNYKGYSIEIKAIFDYKTKRVLLSIL